MNRVLLIGRIASTIKVEEVSTRLGLRPRASLLLAVRRPVRDATEPDWIRMETWGIQADNLVKHCSKGTLVGIDGHIRGQFLNPDGQVRGGRLRLLVVGEAITYLDRASGTRPVEPDSDVVAME
jgi:single-strand DNA-binding protein